MSKKLFLLLLISHLAIFAKAQDLQRSFELLIPKLKVPQSLYNKIEFLDSRADSSQIGPIQVGLLRNTNAKLILGRNFGKDIQLLLDSLIDSTAGNGKLLFQLRQFSFVEQYGSRYCYLIASLYADKDNLYNQVGLLDTVFIVRSSDVAKGVKIFASKFISEFISHSIHHVPSNEHSFTRTELQQIDSLEMANLPIYNTDKYVDGIYTSYDAFKIQAPDKTGFMETHRDGSISSVHALNDQGKKVKIKPHEVYAVIHHGVIYMATEFGYYITRRQFGEFIFTGDIRIAASSNDISTGGLVLGLSGAALAMTGNRETFILLVDHLSGRPIHLSRVQNSTESTF